MSGVMRLSEVMHKEVVTIQPEDFVTRVDGAI